MRGARFKQTVIFALVATLVLVASLAVFIAVERAVTPRYCLETSVDRSIPFLPLTLPIYVAFFPFVVAASAIVDRRDFVALQAATLVAFAIAIVCFCLLPVTMARPDLSLIESAFWRQRFSRMWQLDAATNGFPSLHVAATCLAAGAWARRRHGRLAVVFAFLICVSTLTVKQHTLLDAVGGAVLAVGSRAVVRRFRFGWPNLEPT